MNPEKEKHAPTTRRQWLQQAGATAAATVMIPALGNSQITSRNSGQSASPAIVLGRNSTPFSRWTAGELQRYLRLLTGTEFAISSVEEAPTTGDQIWFGGPNTNEWVAMAQQKGLVSFTGLKKDGFLLQRVKWNDGRSVLVVGGQDEAANMYAAYELLERMGVVFQLTGDIIPEQKAFLKLPDLNLRMEPALKYRGLHMRHFVMPWMGMQDFRKFLDQLAKMKCNYLEFYWYVGAPWIEYSYRGENKLIGDLYPKETGYTTWRANTGTFTASDVKIGREYFPKDRVCAPEFQDCETPAEAYRAGRELLRQIIDYARERKIQVWLGMGDCPGVPPNLGRHAKYKHWDVMAGTMISAGDPVGVEIWVAAIKSMIETYPSAAGYWVWLAENYYRQDDSESKKVIAQYDPYRKLIPSLEQIREMGYDRPTTNEEMESDIGLIHYGKTITETVSKEYPSAKLGIAVLGRSYLFRALDALVPKQIAFSSMESSGVWNRHSSVPMELFGGFGERDRILIPRLDDDESEFGMQFNTTLYYHDQVLEGSVQNGVAGVAPQTGKLRGLEQNAKYVAQGAWQADLTPERFYQTYARSLFGEAAPAMAAAFLSLEANEKFLGWRGFGNFINYADMPEITLMRLFRIELNPFDGPDSRIEKAAFHFHAPEFLDPKQDTPLWIQANKYKYKLFGESIRLLSNSVAQMQSVEKWIPAGSRTEWKYIVQKTRQLSMHLESVRFLLAGYLDYGAAFQSRGKDDVQSFLNLLASAESNFVRARERAEETARNLAEMNDDPTERYLLFHYNVRFVLPIAEFCKFIRNVVNFHNGQPYWEKVQWDLIAPSEIGGDPA
jgi:Glycosyl hydrolase family 67 N-terminus